MRETSSLPNFEMLREKIERNELVEPAEITGLSNAGATAFSQLLLNFNTLIVRRHSEVLLSFDEHKKRLLTRLDREIAQWTATRSLAESRPSEAQSREIEEGATIVTPKSMVNKIAQKVVSERRRLANQRNAEKSTGPKTAAGKRKVRANAIKHGLLSTVTASCKFERSEELKSFLSSQEKLLKPTTPVAKRLVGEAASLLWDLLEVGKVFRVLSAQKAPATRLQSILRYENCFAAKLRKIVRQLALINKEGKMNYKSKKIWDLRETGILWKEALKGLSQESEVAKNAGSIVDQLQESADRFDPLQHLICDRLAANYFREFTNACFHSANVRMEKHRINKIVDLDPEEKEIALSCAIVPSGDVIDLYLKIDSLLDSQKHKDIRLLLELRRADEEHSINLDQVGADRVQDDTPAVV